MKGFIAFEGVEGSGKSSALKEVARRLSEEGIDFILTREPGGSPISEQIREVILNKANTRMDGKTEALLYAASRRQHLVDTVWPALKEGKLVICDRYLDSSLAYQGGARGLGIDNVLNVNEFAIDGTFPELTILFDIDPKLGLERIAANKGREVNRLDLEAISFHESVRKAYLELASRYPERFLIIDASKDQQSVANEVYQAIKALIDK